MHVDGQAGILIGPRIKDVYQCLSINVEFGWAVRRCASIGEIGETVLNGDSLELIWVSARREGCLQRAIGFFFFRGLLGNRVASGFEAGVWQVSKDDLPANAIAACRKARHEGCFSVVLAVKFILGCKREKMRDVNRF